MSGPDVSICVCTVHRAAMLQRCLDSLARLLLPAGLRVEIVVVDNDAQGSARLAAARVAQRCAWPLRYVVEPEPGVSFARNRCVMEAAAPWVAFIDDDEAAAPDWLAQLWRVASSGQVDGVFGPVLAEYATVPDPVLRASGAHQRPRYPTGTRMAWGDCRTGNVLFRRELHPRVGGFGERFAHSGGEDCDFFWCALELGARLVWCDEAIVREHVPAERMTSGWVLRRAYVGGRNFTTLRTVHLGWRTGLRDRLWGLAGVLLYAAPVIWSVLVQSERRLLWQRKSAGSLGKLLAPVAAGAAQRSGAARSAAAG